MPAPPARDLPHLWFLALHARVRLPPWAIGLLISLAITALYVAMELVYPAADAATKPLWTTNHVGRVITVALLVGYLPTFICYGVLAGGRSRRELRPLWRNSDAEIDAIQAKQRSPTTRGFRLAGLAGVLIATPFTSYVGGIPLASFFLLEGWDHYRVFSYGMNIAIWTMTAPMLYLWFSVQGGRFYGRLSWKLDLLDLRPLAPVVREGTTLALLWIVLISIISLMFLADSENPRLSVFFIGILLLSLAGMAAALMLPMRGVQRLISRLKQEELERVRTAIRGDRSALADSGIAAEAETLSLADLVAYRDLIASVREWPVQPTAFLRLSLLLVIPIGSWLGGALFERMLGSLLD